MIALARCWFRPSRLTMEDGIFEWRHFSLGRGSVIALFATNGGVFAGTPLWQCIIVFHGFRATPRATIGDLQCWSG